MNRATALVLAMAALLAHALAIHLDEIRRFGTPYESAHVAYRLARNFVREGVFAWNVRLEGELRGSLGSYPSPLWVAVAVLAELRWFSVALFTQFVGMVSAFATVAVSARFATNRVAGVIPAVLMVSSGCFAAAAASGMEYSLAALLFCMSFVALEHRRNVWLALGLAGLAAARPEAVLIVPAFAVLVVLERFVPRRDSAAPMPIWTVLPAFLVLAMLLGREWVSAQQPYLELVRCVVTCEGSHISNGLAYLRDALVSTGLPLMLPFPLITLATGRLSGAGVRALALTALWTGLVVLQGGGPQAYAIAFVPCLPILCVAIQQGLVAAIDTGQRYLEYVSWAALVATVSISVLASKYPGDLGPLKTFDIHQQWMTGKAHPPYGREPYLGRTSLGQEIRLAQELRDLGSFMKRHLAPHHTVLTPYPGAIGYLSGTQVLDLFGRAVRAPNASGAPAWEEHPSADLLANLALEPDFIHPGRLHVLPRLEQDALIGIDPALALLDVEAPLTIELADDYELVTLPVRRGYGPSRGGTRPTFVLRNRSLDLAPGLAVTITEGRVRVEAHNRRTDGDAYGGHPQLARLLIEAVDDAGAVRHVDPSGNLTVDRRVHARTGLLIAPTAVGVTRLFEAPLPQASAGRQLVEIRAQLVNPGVRLTHPLAPASAKVSLRL
ncbi:MAG: hypothetical protein GY711_33625 [bacterium]|nr:hypothetical protein [bacterium]